MRALGASHPRSSPEPRLNDPIVAAFLLFGVGLVAGVINVIAGGGTFLTLPLMIFLGLPPTVANGTNRPAILIQSAGAAWSFRKKGLMTAGWLELAGPPAMIGAVIGTLTAVQMGEAAFQRTIGLLMVGITAWTLWRPLPDVGESNAPLPEGGRRLAFLLAFGAVGFYGGFIQAGVGFLVLAVTSAAGLDLIRGNAVKVALLAVFTPLSLVVFAMSGKVDWVFALWLAAGHWLGGLLGVRLQILKGNTWVRNVVTAAIIVFAVKLLFDA